MSSVVTIDELHAGYKRRYGFTQEKIGDLFQDLYKKIAAKRVQDIVDAAAVGIAANAWLSVDGIEPSDWPVEVREAFSLAYPHVSLDTLADSSPDRLEGMVSALKGKLFEVTVRDRLNEGQAVGDWSLTDGQHAELAESATQPGWDLKITDSDGHIDALLQLKATDYKSYVNEALNRYPDIPIIATDDIHELATASGLVSDSGFSEDAILHTASDALLGDASPEILDGVLESIPFPVVAITEAWAVANGAKTRDEAIASATHRVASSAIGGTAGGTIGSAIGAVLGSGGLVLGVAGAVIGSIVASKALRESRVLTVLESVAVGVTRGVAFSLGFRDDDSEIRELEAAIKERELETAINARVPQLTGPQESRIGGSPPRTFDQAAADFEGVVRVLSEKYFDSIALVAGAAAPYSHDGNTVAEMIAKGKVRVRDLLKGTLFHAKFGTGVITGFAKGDELEVKFSGNRYKRLNAASLANGKVSRIVWAKLLGGKV